MSEVYVNTIMVKNLPCFDNHGTASCFNPQDLTNFMNTVTHRSFWIYIFQFEHFCKVGAFGFKCFFDNFPLAFSVNIGLFEESLGVCIDGELFFNLTV